MTGVVGRAVFAWVTGRAGTGAAATGAGGSGLKIRFTNDCRGQVVQTVAGAAFPGAFVSDAAVPAAGTVVVAGMAGTGRAPGAWVRTTGGVTAGRGGAIPPGAALATFRCTSGIAPEPVKDGVARGAAVAKSVDGARGDFADAGPALFRGGGAGCTTGSAGEVWRVRAIGGLSGV